MAGINAAAPFVALASLAVTIGATGPAAAASQTAGMTAGAIALVTWCVCGVKPVKRFGPSKDRRC